MHTHAFRFLPHLILLAALVVSPMPASAMAGAQPAGANIFFYNIYGPAGSEVFGARIYTLPNGNFVVTDPLFDQGTVKDVGAVYLYNGETRALISTLTGSRAEDQVANRGVHVLPNGNFLVLSPQWAKGNTPQVGAVTFCRMTTGCNGQVSIDNSLVGTSPNDLVGDYGSILDLNASSYLVSTNLWDGPNEMDAGAITWCSAASGCTGEISAANSLVGTQTYQGYSNDITLTTDGHYLVSNGNWNEARGAVTRCSMNGGCTGIVSEANSLVGSNPEDHVGNNEVLDMGNGNFVLGVPDYDLGAVTNAGAVVFCAGASGGCIGKIKPAKSLTGSRNNDQVGYRVGLEAGGYVVYSPYWNNGPATEAGAVTYCSAAAGCSSAVSADNSLVGTTSGDWVGITPSDYTQDDAYVVISNNWHNSGLEEAGAVTFCKVTGTGGCSGPISADNSLVGSSARDGQWIAVWGNAQTGDYAVSMPLWDKGSVYDAGLVMVCSAVSGCSGSTSADGGLSGSSNRDSVGLNGARASIDGVFAVSSPDWSNYKGAITLCNPTSCRGQEISDANSLVGDQNGDHVGGGVIHLRVDDGQIRLTANHLAWHQETGAVTFCSTDQASLPAGCTGVVSADNSLVGSKTSDAVGANLYEVGDGSYLVSAPGWTNGTVREAGAVTWCPASGCKGPVSAANSLVGSHISDRVGHYEIYPLYRFNPATQKDDALGSYVIRSVEWDNGTKFDAGALTYCPAGGCTGPISAANSLVGTHDGEIAPFNVMPLNNGSYIAFNVYHNTPTTRNAGAVTWCSAEGGCKGSLAQQYSVTGEHTQNYKYKIDFAFEPVFQRVIVGRPADKTVTLMELGFDNSIYLPQMRKFGN